MKKRVTPLEAFVLAQIVRGEDPWGGRLGNSRRVSQTVGRLRRKGLVQELGGLKATPDGVAESTRHGATS